MRHRWLTWVLLPGWILWISSDGIRPPVPINGYATLRACRTEMKLRQVKLTQQELEKGMAERAACFPSDFDPRSPTRHVRDRRSDAIPD